MTDKELELFGALHTMFKNMQRIEFICDRAKRHYIEEKDIDEIYEIVKESLRPSKRPPGGKE